MAAKGGRLRTGVRSRVEAAQRLVRIQEDGAFASLVEGTSHSADVERFVTQYVGGVTRWRRWLDYLVADSYRGNLDEMEPGLREILRIGAFDLAVSGTASHAAVNEAVDAARVLVRPGAAKLANGVLRSIDRKRDAWGAAMRGDSVEELGTRWSHPDWMVERWLGRFGVEETRRLLEHNNRSPIFSLRVIHQRPGFESFLKLEHVSWQSSRYLDDYVRVDRLQPVLRGGWFRTGACVVQDESAGLVVRLLDPQPGDRVVDACAAPGGKSRYIAERIGEEGVLHAVDASASRLTMLDPASLDAKVHIVAADFREWADAHPASADRVLVDAPCTGLGVLSSRADLRWRRTPEDFDRLEPVQRSLLNAAAKVVRPGGTLVYATCTIAPEENEVQVRLFLETHPEFRLEPASEYVPETMVTREGFFASLPQRDGIDGAFGARMVRLAD